MLCRFGNSSGTAPCRQSKPCAVAPVLQGRSWLWQQRQVAVIALAGAVTEGAEQQEFEQEQQQQQRQQQQQSQQRDRREEKYTATRARRLSRAVGDNSTPNTGVIVITERSNVPGAAACVAADFKTTKLTRIVPFTPDLTQKAFDVHRLAASMLNNNLQQEAAGEQDVAKQALVFQPVEIIGDLVASPALPPGAVALYTSCIRADHQDLQEALSKRAAALAAAEAGGVDYVSEGPGEGSQRVFVSKNSDFIRVAGALNQALSREGWAELVCVGRLDKALPVALQALVKIRRIRYGKHQDDASMVLLGDEGILGVNARSNAASREGVRPPTSFLLMRCGKNYPTKLLKMEQSSASTDS